MFIFSHFSPSKKSSSRRRTPWVMWRELSRGVAAISAFGTIEEEDGEEMRRDSEMHIFQRESREILGKKIKKRGNVEESTSKTSQKYLKVIKQPGK